MGPLVSELNVNIISPFALSAPNRALWQQFRADNPALYSPYFALSYTQVLAQHCPDVYVLEVLDGQTPTAFLPFQGHKKPGGRIGFARPVGAPLTDYHGFICAPHTQLDPQEILRKARIGAYHFSAMPPPNPDIFQTMPCAVIDTENWRQDRDSSYRRHLKSHKRRVRKAEETGERRFVFRSNDQDVFEQLIRWKRQQFAATGKYDVLAAPWTRNVLHTLWQQNPDKDLRADMHVLYIGDTLAAIDLGLTDGAVFHSWMVAYNHELQHLAPGIQLLEALIDQASTLGYLRLDLGPGLDGYKRQYASEHVRVSSGVFTAQGPKQGPEALFAKLYFGAENFGDKNLGRLGHLPGKLRRRYGQIRACNPSTKGRIRAVISTLTPR